MVRARAKDGRPRDEDADQEHAAGTWRALGYPRALDYDSNNLLMKLTHSWGSPLLVKGRKLPFTEADALPVLSPCDRIDAAVRRYEEHYDLHKEQGDVTKEKIKHNLSQNGFLLALLRAHASLMLLHSLWALLEMAFRVLSPYALRQLIRWLQRYDQKLPGTKERNGWMWAALVVLLGLGLTLAHHQLFWVGMRFGFVMKQQVCPHSESPTQKPFLVFHKLLFNSIGRRACGQAHPRRSCTPLPAFLHLTAMHPCW
jgi:hypothetical protein